MTYQGSSVQQSLNQRRLRTHLGVNRTELASPIAERDDLRRTHKCKVVRVEEQHNILACAQKFAEGASLAEE